MEGLRASDLFVGWIDLERIAIPQADEHQRLLSRVIDEISPLPLLGSGTFPTMPPV